MRSEICGEQSEQINIDWCIFAETRVGFGEGLFADFGGPCRGKSL